MKGEGSSESIRKKTETENWKMGGKQIWINSLRKVTPCMEDYHLYHLLTYQCTLKNFYLNPNGWCR